MLRGAGAAEGYKKIARQRAPNVVLLQGPVPKDDPGKRVNVGTPIQ